VFTFLNSSICTFRLNFLFITIVFFHSVNYVIFCFYDLISNIIYCIFPIVKLYILLFSLLYLLFLLDGLLLTWNKFLIFRRFLYRLYYIFRVFCSPVALYDLFFFDFTFSSDNASFFVFRFFMSLASCIR